MNNLPKQSAFKKMIPLLAEEKKSVAIAMVAVLANSGLNLIGPLTVGYVIDRFVLAGDYHGVLVFSGMLLAIYIAAFIANYIQMRVMGGVAQRMLFRIRNDVFGKIQELPLAFFNKNKSGDLTARINRDTERLNEFFSQGIMRFVGSFFIILGAGIFVVCINWRLGLAALAPAAAVFIFTRAIGGWTKKRNLASLNASGAISGEVQEAIANFKVILAFNRRDYFKTRFGEVNDTNFKAAFKASIANELITPVFEFAGNVALLIVLGFGIYLIAAGQLAIGILISFVIYITRFYDPLREISRLWSTFQTALAAWDRIGEILHTENDLKVVPVTAGEKNVPAAKSNALIEFKNVSFDYPGGSKVLHDVSFAFEKGKTYALVGPTGGGKTTTASLIARLYDPTSGAVYLNGKDIKSYEPAERAAQIGFILQEPFLFAGDVRENILYGNAEMQKLSAADLEKVLRDSGFAALLERFDKGLDTKIGTASSISLGQKQLIAFIRAVLRKPKILILDEASANIDTITEQQLEKILELLPAETARVVIAHRLNTIENADEIFFVNSGTVTPAGSMEHAVDMLLHHKRKS